MLDVRLLVVTGLLGIAVVIALFGVGNRPAGGADPAGGGDRGLRSPPPDARRLPGWAT
ncbi:hypothetical protein [Modestobacter sp. I12A-02662]|uniref:hypothetical protein n=1 Tax=Modestobacter sp. I12A-02662 TaxID=1730496 RepID=UPI0034DE7715